MSPWTSISFAEVLLVTSVQPPVLLYFLFFLTFAFLVDVAPSLPSLPLLTHPPTLTTFSLKILPFDWEMRRWVVPTQCRLPWNLGRNP